MSERTRDGPFQIDKQGRSWLWAAVSDGLVRYDNQQRQALDAAALALPADACRTLTPIADDERALLWAGTNRHGLVRLDVSDPARPNLVSTPQLPELPDPTIYSVLPDSRGGLHICTNNGIQQLTLLADAGYSGRVFRRRGGLLHDECSTHSQFIDAHDRYWVGTLGGLSVYDPRTATATRPARGRTSSCAIWPSALRRRLALARRSGAVPSQKCGAQSLTGGG